VTRTLDITDLTCPMTWVKTKLELERMAPGEALDVRCREGEALENVPRSAREAGHAESVELRVLALHGLLHLLGYDHGEDMERRERELVPES